MRDHLLWKSVVRAAGKVKRGGDANGTTSLFTESIVPSDRSSAMDRFRNTRQENYSSVSIEQSATDVHRKLRNFNKQSIKLLPNIKTEPDPPIISTGEIKQNNLQ